MFCPDINAECKREECRDWLKEGKCRITLQYEENRKVTQDQLKFMGGYTKLIEIERFNYLISKDIKGCGFNTVSMLEWQKAAKLSLGEWVRLPHSSAQKR
jgi:kynurenine formamidase